MSSTDCPTEKISQLLDIILNPYAQETLSYIKDTTDFITKVSNLTDISDDDWIFSMDVTSLYTNIPLSEGLQIVKEIIKNRTGAIPNTRILQLLQTVLENNNFKFNGINFLQIEGTAMGTRVALTYANIFMADFENRHIFNNSQMKPRMWFSFIDDVWDIFKGTEEQLIQFKNYCNKLHLTIKFTIEYSKTHVNFLDLITYKQGNKILTTLYKKPTNSHSHLHYDSCHPDSIKNSIPHSQFLRIRRNCSHWVHFMSNALRMYVYFQLRGYPHTLLKQYLVKVNKLHRSDCLMNKIIQPKSNNTFLFNYAIQSEYTKYQRDTIESMASN